MDVSRVKIDPSKIFWGEQLIQKVAIGTPPGAGDYFLLETASGLKFAIWFELNLVGAAPAEVGYTNVKVVLGATPTAAQTATALAAVFVPATHGVKAAVEGTTDVIIADMTLGEPAEIEDGATPTGFTFTVEQEGAGGEIGYTSGDTEFTPAVETRDVVAHQAGNTPINQYVTKVSVENIALTLMEVDAAQIKDMFSAVGGTKTPVAGTEVVGLGTAKIGGSLFAGARKLVFHPMSKAALDRTADICFFKATPIPNTVKTSGTEENTLSVEFGIYPDPAIASEVDVMGFGDWTQDLSA